ncbi:hypothetical protein HRbin28_02306 [bacterium HR28]|nr:hypothetical protein HRbin28_02306 [bacterium HR28]
MAQERRVTVEHIEERTSSEGKRYWRVKVAGEKRSYFVWDPDVADALVVGQTYQATVNGSAEYPRITSVAFADDAAPAPAAPTPGERERRMLRMSALRAAADVLHGSAVPASELLAYAEQLLAWLEQ